MARKQQNNDLIIKRLKQGLEFARRDEEGAERYLEFCQQNTGRFVNELKDVLEARQNCSSTLPRSQCRSRSRSKHRTRGARQLARAPPPPLPAERRPPVKAEPVEADSDLHPVWKLLVDYLKKGGDPKGVWLSTINVDLAPELVKFRSDGPGSLKRLRQLCNDLQQKFSGVLIFDETEIPKDGDESWSKFDCAVRLELDMI